MIRDGFDSFFQERYSRTVLLLIVMGASQANADDAVQEAMIAAWQQWDSIRGPAAWLRTIAIRALWKHQHQQHATPLEHTTEKPAAGDPDLMIFAEEQQRILRLLRGLPPAQRTVTALFYDGLTPAEIAGLTGRPVTTVRSHLRHARTSLKEAIASDSPPAPHP